MNLLDNLRGRGVPNVAMGVTNQLGITHQTPIDSFLGRGGSMNRYSYSNSNLSSPIDSILKRQGTVFGGRQFGTPGMGAKFRGMAGRVESTLGARLPRMGGMSMGRLGVTAGFGALALSQAGNFVDRMRTGDYAGAALHGGLAVAAGGAAYSASIGKMALRKHFKNAVSFLEKRMVA